MVFRKSGPVERALKMNSLREKIENKGFVVGSWINTGSPIIAEIMAQAGFDFLAIDIEHSPIDLSQTLHLLQAIQAGNPNCYPLVRLPSTDPTIIKRYLDAGACGVIAPMVNTPEMAETVVSAVKYPPLGKRGVGFSRSNFYGMMVNRSVVMDNERTFVCVQIEHIDGVNNLAEILSVSGIDAVLIGPYDLSASLGITGQLDHPEMESITEKIFKSCVKHRVYPGIHIVSPEPEETIKKIDYGYRFVACSLDITMVANICKNILDQIHKR